MGLIQKLKERIMSKDAMVRDIRKSYGASIFKYSEKYKTDRNLVKEAVFQDGELMQYFPEFRGDKEIILIALQTSIDAFSYSTEELRNDRTFIVEAVKIDPRVMESRYMLEKFRQDEELINLAEQQRNIMISTLK